MKYCILAGSPRKNGNTSELLGPFIEELELGGIDYSLIWLYDKKIKPCIACQECQNNHTDFGCPQNDDLQEIFCAIMESDVIVLATPIYSWYCTAPMKSLLDRLVYGMNNYYGEQRGGSLWQGKKMAIVATCGYRPEEGVDLFEEGIRRYCKHSRLKYVGILAERDLGHSLEFMTKEKDRHSRGFAQGLMERD